jgi:pimeloyl-ACP methyl ester carboxylesterase
MSVESSRTFHGAHIALAASTFGDEQGTAIVFLHGGGQTRHSWNRAARALAARGWFAISLDLRGHGESGWHPDGDYSLDAFAADVNAVLADLGRPAVLIGASLGGLASLIAVGESDDQDDRVLSLVLVDIATRGQPVGVERVHGFMAAAATGFESLEDAAEAIARYNPGRPRPRSLEGLRRNLRQNEDGRWYWHWDPRFLDDRERFTGNTERLERAAQSLTIPVLLVRGGTSELISREDAEHLLGLVADAELADVAGAGHMVAGDRNDVFTGEVAGYLARRLPVPSEVDPDIGGPVP